MYKSAKRTDGKKADGGEQLWLRLSAMVRDALYDTVMVMELPRFGRFPLYRYDSHITR